MKINKIIKKNIILIVVKFLITLEIVAMGTFENSLIISKEIKFEILLQDGVSVEPAILDFGDIVRGSRSKVIRESNLIFTSSFSEDMLVDIQFDINEDKTPDDENFAKIEIQNVDENKKVDEENIIDVYIKRVKHFNLKSGEINVPIIGEIREVKEDIALGKYEKNISVNVTLTLYDPSEKI